MRTPIVLWAILSIVIGCDKKQATKLESPGIAVMATPSAERMKVMSGQKLFLDVHHFGPGKVTAEAVAAAHQKDLAAQAKHGVKYLDYWFDRETGTVMCLAEAPSAEAALDVHKEAHGLMPDSIDQVSESR